MDDRLKELFDSMEPEEVDELLKDINTAPVKTNETKISEKRIRKTVLKKAGVPGYVRNRRIYVIVASAAVFFLSVGVISLAYFNPGKKTAVRDEASTSEATEYVGDYDLNMDSAISEEIPACEEPAAEEPAAEEPSESSSEKGPIEKKIALYEGLSSGETGSIVSGGTYVIDMNGFTGKYSSLKQIEDDCDYIIRGTKVGESFEYSVDMRFRLVASIRVDEMIVDYNGVDLPDIIQVSEGILYDANMDATIHRFGYERMKNGGHYVLFLKGDTSPNFKITGTIYGKIPEDANEEAFIPNDELASDERIAVIRQIIEDARNEYVLKGNTSEETEPSETEVSDPETTAEPVETTDPAEETTEEPAEQTTETPSQVEEPSVQDDGEGI